MASGALQSGPAGVVLWAPWLWQWAVGRTQRQDGWGRSVDSSRGSMIRSDLLAWCLLTCSRSGLPQTWISRVLDFHRGHEDLRSQRGRAVSQADCLASPWGWHTVTAVPSPDFLLPPEAARQGSAQVPGSRQGCRAGFLPFQEQTLKGAFRSFPSEKLCEGGEGSYYLQVQTRKSSHSHQSPRAPCLFISLGPERKRRLSKWRSEPTTHKRPSSPSASRASPLIQLWYGGPAPENL